VLYSPEIQRVIINCEELQSSALEAQSQVEEQSEVDEQRGDECLTPPRPKKSKSKHVGAAQYKC